jgi:tRNA(Ile)-lysidine synthase TilS/MesJ
MRRQHISLSPDRSIVIVAVSGARDSYTYAHGSIEFLTFYLGQPARKILFDAAGAYAAIESAKGIELAEECGKRMPQSRIAIVAREMDCAYARIWRRALSATGHEAYIFKNVAEAEAWLRTEADEDTLYVA